MSSDLVKKIDQALPQTQCGECGYAACRPYAEAIVHQGEALNLCPPGGVKTLKALGELMQQDIAPFIDEVSTNTRPTTVAFIHEELCIGCTKCIQACPVDAIVGAAKLMHTVIVDDCTGCQLCIEPCPMDCIDLLAIELTEEQQQKKANLARQHYQRAQARQTKHKVSAKQRHETAKQAKKTEQQTVEQARKDYIAQALARVKAKKK